MSNAKFKEYKGLNLTQLSQEVLEKWDREDTFRQSVLQREGSPAFIFYEGPPSANGMPGIHHMMARTIKDIICRYKTGQGYKVNRKAGWDTHGLPVELGVEKKLGITKDEIGTKITIEEYNRTCREAVMEYTDVWGDLTRKMGYWVNTDDAYITYDNKYIETLWWMLKQLYEKGLLYKGYTIQPYSPGAGTGLSTHELNQPGCYRDVKDTTATALFRIVNPKEEMTAWGTPCFAAWTTTPWTLPSNTALCVGPKIGYVCVQTYNPYNGEKISVVMAEARVNAYFKAEGAELPMDEYKAGDKVVPYRIVANYTGAELEGLRYEQLMPWVKPLEKADNNAAEWVKAYAAEHPEKCFDIQKDRFVELSECAFRVIPGDYVTTDDGTGIVHIAPTFGADDAKVAKAAGIPSLFMINKRGETRPMVDMTGKYYLMEECDATFVEKCVNAEGYKQHEGAYVKNAYDPQFNPDGKYDEKAAAKAEDLNIFLCMEMKQAGTALKIEKHTHNYPHCWRTDKPVLYYPLDSWFIRTTACRERMMELNEGIYWKPESTGSGRFGKWLENLQDWNLSRSRFWGTPLPIWATDDYSEFKCIGSVEELKAEIEKSIAAGVMTTNPYADFNVGDFSKENYDKIDLHRPYVDNIVLVSSKGEPMHRESDLIDVWFDSGAMPYAQVHFPFEMSKEEFLKVYPSDFIAEGVDQTRGWFFTLHALGTMLFDSVAFKNIISNGLVLDKNGNKMSKRLGNAIDPFEVMDKYGVDAVRWYIISNSQPWDNLKFDVDGVDEVRRKFFGTLYNTYSFFALYANVDGFTGREAEVPVEERPEIDRWIISLLNTLVANVTKCLDDYDPTPAARMIQEFVGENLSNWYVRLNRKRFWGGEMTTDKLAAYQTLYTCLETVAQLSAPFAPFIAEQIFCDLNAMSGRHTEESVHLALFPKSNSALVNSDLEEMMAVAQQVSSMVLALRRKVNIKVRQPLTKIIVPLLDEKLGAHIEAVKSLVMGEVNIKDIELISDTTGLITKRIKPNFKTLGPRYGKYMKQIAALVAEMGQEQIAEIEASETYVLNVAGEDLTLERADFEITSDDMPGWLVASEGKLTVALDITVTDELRKEGTARELINRIQNIRKDSGLEVTDRIRLSIQRTDEVAESVEAFGSLITSQTLAVAISVDEQAVGTWVCDTDINEMPLQIGITKE